MAWGDGTTEHTLDAFTDAFGGVQVKFVTVMSTRFPVSTTSPWTSQTTIRGPREP